MQIGDCSWEVHTMTEQPHGPRSEATRSTADSAQPSDGCQAARDMNPAPVAATPGESLMPQPDLADAALPWSLWAEVQSVAVRWRSPHPDGPIPTIPPRPCPAPTGPANPGPAPGMPAAVPANPCPDELLPFVLVRIVFTMSSQPVPQALRARVQWHDDAPQSWLEFDPQNCRPGDTWELTLPVYHTVPIDNYRYTVEVEVRLPDGRVQRDQWSDWAGVAGEGLDNPFGWTQTDS
jgi:hypothetical protein